MRALHRKITGHARVALVALPSILAAACNAFVSFPDAPSGIDDDLAHQDGGIDAHGSVTPDGSLPDAARPEVDVSTPEASAPSDASDATALPTCTGVDASSFASDPDNCGWCGHACGSGGCSSGLCSPTMLLSDVPQFQGIDNITLWNDQLYFTSWCGSTPGHRMPKNGGSVAGLGGGIACGGGLRRFGDRVYFVIVRSASPVNVSDVVSVDSLSTGARLEISGVTDQIWDMVLDGTTLIYSTGWDGQNGIFARELGADAAAEKQIAMVAAESMVLKDDKIYFAGGDAVGVVDKTGGSATTLYPGVHPKNLKNDGDNLFWIDEGASSVLGGTIHGTTSYPIATSLPKAPNALTLDAKSLYFLIDATIYGVDRDGSRFREYATWTPDPSLGGNDVATDVAVDDQFVYWARRVSAGASMGRVAK